MYRMNVQRKRIILLLALIYLQSQAVFSQDNSSKDNYTGAWETPSSWSPTWTVPHDTIVEGGNFFINGYITVNGSLSFSTLASNLIINDTLVINGDLLLDNNNNLLVNGNGILIIKGNFNFNNKATIVTNNYIVILGNINKGGLTMGSFISNSNPTKVFVSGTIFPADLTNNKLTYPALNCTTPITTPYLHSKCSYGDIIDLINDPIYSFFQSNCTMTAAITITDNSGIANNDGVICNGATATITASGGTSYSWSTGDTTAAIVKGTAGTYTVTVTNANGCTDTKTAAITVNSLPATPTITADGPTDLCAGGNVTLTSSSGTSYLWSNAASTASINVTKAGSYTVRVTNASGCQSEASIATIVTVIALPVAAITITDNSGIANNDGIISNGAIATLTASGGTSYRWSSGETTAAIIRDIAGIYTVTVTDANGCANEASAEVIISVYDPFIPSVITPNGDGKNDYFKISEIIGQVELIIFNRWGNEEYTNSNYLNNWDGRNNKGVELPNDTYFYILKFERGKIIKGSILIKR